MTRRGLAKPVSGGDPTLRQDMEPRFGIDLLDPAGALRRRPPTTWSSSP